MEIDTLTEEIKHMQVNEVKSLFEVIVDVNIEERERIEKDNENNPKKEKNISSLEENSEKEIEEEQILSEDDLNNDLLPVEELKKNMDFRLI